jgi:hypothetical protein
MYIHLPVWEIAWESASLAIRDCSSVFGNTLMVMMSNATMSCASHMLFLSTVVSPRLSTTSSLGSSPSHKDCQFDN